MAVKVFKGEASPDGRAADEVAVTCHVDHPNLTRSLFPHHPSHIACPNTLPETPATPNAQQGLQVICVARTGCWLL